MTGVAATGHGPERRALPPATQKRGVSRAKRVWPLGHPMGWSDERRQGPPWTNFAGPEGRARPQDFAGPETPRPGADGGASEATRRGPGAMGSARARPGPILSGLKIRAPTETGSPSGPKREWPLGHRRKDATARCRSPVGDPRPGRNGERPRAKKGVAPRPPGAMGVASGPRKVQPGAKSEASAEQPGEGLWPWAAPGPALDPYCRA